MEKNRTPNMFSCSVVILLSFVSIFYFIVSMNNGNWTWFLTNLDLERPSRIVISDFGERTILTVENDSFDRLRGAITSSISNLDNTELIPIGLSETAIEDYKKNSFVLEVHYHQPVEINAIFRTGDPTRILIPIQGRNAKEKLFFIGDSEGWWFGGLRMASAQPIYVELIELGYLQEDFQP